MENQEIGSKDVEVDLIKLVKLIGHKKLLIVKLTTIFLALGLIVALTSPKEFLTSSTLIPESASLDGNINNSLGGLASLAGVNLGGMASNSKTIHPALYQSVSRSTPFLIEVMNQEFYFNEIDQKITIYEYYNKYSKSGLLGKLMSIPSKIASLISEKSEEGLNTVNTDMDPIKLTEYQKRIIEDLKKRIYVAMDWELNVISIQVEMQDPSVAADLVRFTQDYITEYATDYAIAKSKQQLKSLEQQYQEKRKDFNDAQMRLASFRDMNQNVKTARVKSEEERLQSEYNLIYNVFNQLAQKKEAIKLQIKEDTPVFTILEPVTIPVKKSKPKRRLIVLVSILLGLVISVFWVIIKKYKDLLV